MAVKTNSVDMVNGTLWDKILKFFVIYMLTAFVQKLYGIADVIVVSKFAGEQALAGVGTCSSVVNLFLNFIMGLSAGVTVVLGQSLGKKSDDAGKIVHTAIAVAIIGGALVCLICLTFTKQLLGLIDVPENVMPQASMYLRIVAVGYIPSLTYNFGAGILRAKGDTKRPLYIVSVSGIINVILNLVFVCVFKMQAGGVALATVISQIYTSVMVMYFLSKEEDDTRIYLNKIKIYKKQFAEILKYGIPSGIQSSVYSVSNMLVQSSINSFGSAAIAGSSAVNSITAFYEVMSGSMYQAGIVFTSQNFGAKKFKRTKKTINICIGYAFALWGIQIAVSFFAGEFLVKLCSPDDAAVIEMALRSFKILGFTYGLLGILDVTSGALRGIGASLFNMISTIAGVCGTRVVWIFTVFGAFRTFEVLFACYPVSWFATTILHIITFLVVFRKKEKSSEVLL